MAIVFVMRNRLVDNYNPKKPVWVEVKRKGTKVQAPDGTTIELFRVNTLAEALDRNSAQIKIWEQKKLIPPPIFRIEGRPNVRFYSAEQIINCHRVMMHRYNGNKYFQGNADAFKRFTNDLRRVWVARKVIVKMDGTIEGEQS